MHDEDTIWNRDYYYHFLTPRLQFNGVKTVLTVISASLIPCPSEMLKKSEQR